jgi:hypothetical protein
MLETHDISVTLKFNNIDIFFKRLFNPYDFWKSKFTREREYL